jgi:hypothetical protein
MAMTLAEAQLQLTQINTAIENLLQGKRITQLRVGSGTFQRLYQYQEISYEALEAKRQELLGYIDSLSETTPTFKTGSVPLYVRKNR